MKGSVLLIGTPHKGDSCFMILVIFDFKVFND